ncbi:unnamed protein product [Citrullus colocynthis]|uniref:Signal recognition particle 14 kDa protein n=1 Tax=Citrullus colocynthis TaxID=252529 RepID=A0ABP0Z735_9ROSI
MNRTNSIFTPLATRKSNIVSEKSIIVFPLAVPTALSTPFNGRRSDQFLVLLKIRPTPIAMVLLQLDPFLNELTSMFEHTTEKGSVWVTLKRSSLKSKVQINKLTTAGEPIEYRCLIRATDGKKKISTSVGAKDHLRFQASYSTILKAHMTALKKRERKDKKKAPEAEKGLKKKPRKV